jgi:divalent metal cation (Fe/Co/Zn/Cd) transporter
MALWCNFLVFSLKFGVWIATSSHVMLAEMIHSIADFANQVTQSFTVAVHMFIYLSFLFHGQELII